MIEYPMTLITMYLERNILFPLLKNLFIFISSQKHIIC
jgi:hypothetical protein